MGVMVAVYQRQDIVGQVALQSQPLVRRMVGIPRQRREGGDRDHQVVAVSGIYPAELGGRITPAALCPGFEG